MEINSTFVPYAMACVVINNSGKLLLLKRSPSKKLFPNKWFVIGAAPLSGSDDIRSIALREIKDELGVEGKILAEGQKIKSLMEGKEWIVVPFLASIDTSEIVLNEEHTEYKWIDPSEIRDYETIPNTSEMVQMMLRIYTPLNLQK